jgi:dTMP kinase
MAKGLFIAIYGVNNIGKSTHAKLLTKRLQKEGFKPFYLKYPVYDLEPTGPAINAILRGEKKQRVSETELQTLFMQNRRDYEPTLKKLIEEGHIIVAEDYTGTGIAWGTAKGLDLEYMERLNEGLLKEDLAILISGKRDIRAKEKNHIHESDDALVTKVGAILAELGDRYGWKTVMLQSRIEDTAKLVWEAVRPELGL